MGFATYADLEARHPEELILLGADPASGEVDPERVDAAIADASAEMRTILKARYDATDFVRLDEDSLFALRLFCMDITFYRLALSHTRLTDEIRDRYSNAIKRLESIASGKAGLSFVSSGSDGDAGGQEISSPNEVVIDVPDRVFTKGRLKGF